MPDESHPVFDVRKKPTWRAFNIWLTVSLAVVLVLFAIGATTIHFVFGGDYEMAARYGNAFGVVSALFSALALAAVAAALIQGQRQLQIQQEELEHNTAMLAAQRDELRAQNEFHARREFQTTFFDLLRTLGETVANISINVNEWQLPNAQGAAQQVTRRVQGKSALGFLSDRLKQELETDDRSARDCPTLNQLLSYIDTRYQLFYEGFSSVLGHYFRLLYHIVRFIDSEEIPVRIDRVFYIRILRAQLSQPELYLLFYNCLSSHGHRKFHPLVEKYHLLHNCEERSLPARHLDLYPASKRRFADERYDEGLDYHRYPE